MSYLVLVRHGESRWNTANKFTGWVDVPLSEVGEKEAARIAKNMKDLRLDMAFSSHLERAHQTLLAVLTSQHCTGIFAHQGKHDGFDYTWKDNDDEIPIYTDWVLNERHYGLLQGMNKSAAAKRYGKDQVLAWRRSFDARPPQGESLHDVYDRVVPYFRKMIWPEIRKNKNILIVAHGNTLRAIVKYLEQTSDEQIAYLEIKATQPFIYQFKNGELTKSPDSHSFTRPTLWK